MCIRDRYMGIVDFENRQQPMRSHPPTTSPYAPYDEKMNKEVMSGAWAEYRFVKGPNIMERVRPWGEGVKTHKGKGVWHYYKSTTTGPRPECEGIDDGGQKFAGVNFATQDYLSLGGNQRIKDECIKTVREYGVHSGGSPAAMGRSKYYHALCNEISDFLGTKSTILYATGWLAGYGGISALVRPYDYIIMDKLAHNCLQEGSFIATQNVFMVRHLDNRAIEEKLKEIREKDQENGIMVVTEGLFSMDSDTPNLGELQKICKKYNAILFLDMAHDFGVMGENGRGAWENMGLEDKSNVIFMGAGSKVMCTNFGFVSCIDENVIEYIKLFSTALMFTNAVSPVQATSALTSLKIVRSPEGRQLRKKVIDNSTYVREKLNQHGIQTLGSPSPIVPVMIGDEKIIRVLARFLLDHGILANPMEFPAVPYGTARFRLQVQAGHTKQHLDFFVDAIVKGLAEAKRVVAKIMAEPAPEAVPEQRPRL
eukprot:TRINITY_DN636_c0_g1_i1.p1 TRINITY_DN636_c0_g1~~TRINITY_DN636_c0_g1_i1.p1  ORF type:complete len:481 (+),score=131.22 TRINITY_DN636_c0_g1_i1:65-1507(+)